MEVASDVISGVATDYVGIDVRATFGESALNSGQIIILVGPPDPFYTSLCPVFNCILQTTGSNQRRHVRQICEANYPRQQYEIW